MIFYRILYGRFKDAILHETKREKLDSIDMIRHKNKELLVGRIRLEGELELEEFDLKHIEICNYFSSLYSMSLKISLEANRIRKNRYNEPEFEARLNIANNSRYYTEKVLIMLYDILDITRLTENDLLEIGFPFYIVHTIKILRREQEESYKSYIDRIKNDYYACLTMERVYKKELEIISKNKRKGKVEQEGFLEENELAKYHKALRKKLNMFENYMYERYVVDAITE